MVWLCVEERSGAHLKRDAGYGKRGSAKGRFTNAVKGNKRVVGATEDTEKSKVETGEPMRRPLTVTNKSRRR